MIDLVKNYSINARRIKKSVIRELLELTNKPDVISFAGGLPAADIFPVEQIAEVTNDLLKSKSHRILQYGGTKGLPELIEEIVKWSNNQGYNINSDNVMVTVASQQALDLIAKIFIDPSDPIIVENPSYVGGLQAFASYGAHMFGVDMDDDGILIKPLAKTLKHLKREGEHYKFIYLVPDFQNPTGVTLSEERRKEVLKLSKEYDVLLIEDTPYRELRFEGKEPPSLYQLDDTDNVVSLHTFSKILVPGFRVGWIIAHKDIIDKLIIAKQSVDLCTSNFTQAIIAEFMARGYLDSHIQKVKQVYKKKRDLMLEVLKEYMPEEVRWTNPEGGLFLWVTYPEYINTNKLFYDAIEEKVAYVIGSAFYHDATVKNSLRLNFSYPTEAQIEEGIKRLAKVSKKRIALQKKTYAIK